MMNRKMILLFSHKLCEEQIKYAKDEYNINKFVYLPKDLQYIWSNIDPDIENLHRVLEPIKEFLKTNISPSDFVLIQGDFGASFMMVNFVKDLIAIPVYATTKRIAKEFPLPIFRYHPS
ncbi:MAG: CRISPR-associated protein Csx20 [Campylobacterota bacterium]|nr:CRISPR-associated protein Csx20 [Campylobacterota bacterium]